MHSFSQQQNSEPCRNPANCRCPSCASATRERRTDNILQIQRMVGNQGMQRILQSETMSNPLEEDARGEDAGNASPSEAPTVSQTVSTDVSTGVPTARTAQPTAQNASAQTGSGANAAVQANPLRRASGVINKNSIVNWFWLFFTRNGCYPGFLTALMKQSGKGCNSKAVIYVSYEQCVKKSKCSEAEQLKQIKFFGDIVCKLFCIENNCLQKSHFQPPSQCWAGARCWKPGIKGNPCPEPCPHFAGCSNDALKNNPQWNCHCSRKPLLIV